MTQDDIIKMAKEAGASFETAESMFKFATLVAAAEHQACAKLCDEKVDAEYATGNVDHNEMAWTQACVIAIRARGEK